VKKNIVRISYELESNRCENGIFISHNCDERRRPKKGRPRGGSVPVSIFVNITLPRRASERP
ncbi:MAG TPA: hypothetical protein VJ350_09380, partial [Methanoregula sp.]|nr:hypothetical protein [Methanoregula sp.]